MLTNSEITFAHLVAHFGEISAYHYLAEIERAAQLKPQRSIADPETRLAYALRLQDAGAQSPSLMAA